MIGSSKKLIWEKDSQENVTVGTNKKVEMLTCFGMNELAKKRMAFFLENWVKIIKLLKLFKNKTKFS